MALKPKPGSKPQVKETASEAVSGRTVTLTRGFSIETGDGQWAKASVAITGAVDEVEEIREQVAELATVEVAASIDQLREFSFGGVAAADDDSTDGDDEGIDVADDDDDIGPDQVNAMDRPALETLISENELEIDLTKFKKNPAGLKALRAAIIEVAFSDDDDGAAGDDEGDDDTDAAADDDDGDEITVEDIEAMDRPTLVALIEQNELEVDYAKITKLNLLKKAVIEIMTADDDDGDADDDSGDDDGDEAYTEESLNAMKIADLKALFADWELGKFPAGSPPVQKKLAIKAILKAQAG